MKNKRAFLFTAYLRGMAKARSGGARAYEGERLEVTAASAAKTITSLL